MMWNKGNKNARRLLTNNQASAPAIEMNENAISQGSQNAPATSNIATH